MPQVSRYKMNDVLFEKLFTQFAFILAPQEIQNTKSCLSDLFTDTEKIMFVKRLAIIVMLHEGISSYQIWTTLKMSSSTVARIQDGYEQGCYTHITTALTKNKKKYNTFLQTLGVLLEEMLSQYSGKRRWNWLDGQ